MASTRIIAGADWVQTFDFSSNGNPAFRLDGLIIEAELRAAPGDRIALRLSTEDGTLIVPDRTGARIAASVGWSATDTVQPGDYQLDFRFSNPTTSVVMQSDPIAISVVPRITKGLA